MLPARFLPLDFTFLHRELGRWKCQILLYCLGSEWSFCCTFLLHVYIHTYITCIYALLRNRHWQKIINSAEVLSMLIYRRQKAQSM